MKDPEVGKSWIFFHKLSRPRVITGAKEKFEFEKKNSVNGNLWWHGGDMKSEDSEKMFFELFRPRVNFGTKQKDDLKNFVPGGHPNVQSV